MVPEYSASTVMAHENILVVEDEEDILELVAYNLTREGYEVRGATTVHQQKTNSSSGHIIPMKRPTTMDAALFMSC